jgi:general secretion pathway protein D
MIRCKKEALFIHTYVLIGLSMLLGIATPLSAGRRDWIRRQRSHNALVTQNEQKTETPLPTFLGIPRETVKPLSSLTGLLGVPEEEQHAVDDKKTKDADLYETVEVDDDEADSDAASEEEEEDGAHDEARETISTAIPVEGMPEQIDESTVLPTTAVNYEDEIELYFENADLQNFVQQIEDVFEIKFITEDALDPLPQGGKSLKGNKISYRTHKAISRQQAWNTFNTFLNIAGFAIVPQPDPRVYRITTIPRAQKSPLAAYIGVAPDTLPDSDELIRYVYFIENNTVDALKTVIEQFRSSASSAVYLNEHKGFILTDIAYNIKKLMEVIKELDKVTMPESLSVLKLRRADAKEVKELYDTLVQNEQPNKFGPRVVPKKQPSALSLPENVTIVAEPRTNSLILLGPKTARENIEQFIIKNLDVELDQAYSPLHTYQLRYANAETIAEIMNNVTKFGGDTEAGKSGGVRGGDQYLRPMSFIPEPKTNQLIVRAHYEDFLKAEKVIKLLDEDQPQVAIEVLILSIVASDTKELGTQMRSKVNNLITNSGGWDGLLGNNIKWQTSGLYAGTGPSPIQQNTTATVGVERLLGNLINLVTGSPAGNTIISLGQDVAGVWGILQMLEVLTNVQLVSNPFLIATNKTPAEVSLGETRRVATATVAGATTSDEIAALGNESANLVVQITPQITSDGMIVMDLEITIDNFTDPALTSPTKNTKKIKTSTILANKQVLALGGLVRHQVLNNMSKVPILGDIPILGWFFKNKRKMQEKQNLLVLISARIVEPTNPKDLAVYNNKHISEYHASLGSLQTVSDNRDPIHRLFFAPGEGSTEAEIDDFMFKRRKGRGTRVTRLKERKRKDREAAELIVSAAVSDSTFVPAETVNKRRAVPAAAPSLSKAAEAPTFTASSYANTSPNKNDTKAIIPVISKKNDGPIVVQNKTAPPLKGAELLSSKTSPAQPATQNTAQLHPVDEKAPMQTFMTVPVTQNNQTLTAALKTKRRKNLSVSDMLQTQRAGRATT